jgi:hypothetical protein
MKRLIICAALAVALLTVPEHHCIASDAPPSYENILNDIANAPDAAD